MPVARENGEASRPGPRGSVHRFVPPGLRPWTVRLGRVAREWQCVAMNAMTRVNPRPLLVLGNQKSGTSAIAALLAGATGQSVTLDLKREVWHPSFQRIPSGELSFEGFLARNRWAFSREVVKEPNLTLFVPELLERFPDSAILHVVRDPRDNLRSLLERLQIAGDHAALPPDALALERNPVSTPGWQLVFDDTWRGGPGGHYIEVLARRWQLCAEAYLDRRDRMELCRYEDFRADKLGVIHRLAERFGLPVVADVSDRLDYRFQPPGDSTRRWESFFGAENLERIERICAPGMEALGYEKRADRA